MIMVDDSATNDGRFGYTNKDDDIEHVEIGNYGCISIRDSDGGVAIIYAKDIPKLILALQAAQEYIEKNKEGV